jgi:hypothetical protein
MFFFFRKFQPIREEDKKVLFSDWLKFSKQKKNIELLLYANIWLMKHCKFYLEMISVLFNKLPEILEEIYLKECQLCILRIFINYDENNYGVIGLWKLLMISECAVWVKNPGVETRWFEECDKIWKIGHAKFS